MTDARLPSRWLTDPDLDALTDRAWRVHTSALMWSAEQGTDAMEREKAFLFASEKGRRLAAIDAALRKLYRDPGTFGQCENCGGAIGFARLEALPHTALCISCQTLQEAAGGG